MPKGQVDGGVVEEFALTNTVLMVGSSTDKCYLVKKKKRKRKEAGHWMTSSGAVKSWGGGGKIAK